MLRLFRECRNETPTDPKARARNLKRWAQSTKLTFSCEKQTGWRTMGKERPPKTTRLNIRNNYSERDANGKQETGNIGNETDRRKNVGVG